jgi:hypothetical protein
MFFWTTVKVMGRQKAKSNFLISCSFLLSGHNYFLGLGVAMEINVKSLSYLTLLCEVESYGAAVGVSKKVTDKVQKEDFRNKRVNKEENESKRK